MSWERITTTGDRLQAGATFIVRASRNPSGRTLAPYLSECYEQIVPVAGTTTSSSLVAEVRDGTECRNPARATSWPGNCRSTKRPSRLLDRDKQERQRHRAAASNCRSRKHGLPCDRRNPLSDSRARRRVARNS